jgi:hypothetical protein
MCLCVCFMLAYTSAARWVTAATTVASGASYVMSKNAVVFIKPTAKGKE